MHDAPQQRTTHAWRTTQRTTHARRTHYAAHDARRSERRSAWCTTQCTTPGAWSREPQAASEPRAASREPHLSREPGAASKPRAASEPSRLAARGSDAARGLDAAPGSRLRCGRMGVATLLLDTHVINFNNTNFIFLFYYIQYRIITQNSTKITTWINNNCSNMVS